MNLRCPHCRNAFEIVNEDSVTEVTCPSCKSKISVDELLSINPSMMLTETASENVRMPGEGDSIAHFRINGLIGKGGFGSVFSARDTRLDRDVALKIPRLQKVTRRQAEAFLHEAQTAAQLRDPNIVTVHEIGREGDNVYIVSDLIDGITLNEWVTERHPTQREIATMISHIARSIHKAHEKGVIHRDLKPRNVIVDSENQPHITDFGLAKRENPEEITITTKGQVIGTPAYMSPEQGLGKSHDVDRRTDVYSLGVMLYELAAGKRPYRGESDLLVDEIIDGNPEPIRFHNRAISPDLEAICLKAMSVRPGDRFPTARDLSEDLDRFVAGQPTRTKPPTPISAGLRFAWSRRVQLITIMLLFAAVIWIWWKSQTGNPIANADNPVIFDVSFQVFPPNAAVHIAFVDLENGKIDLENVKTPVAGSVSGIFHANLQPGWYVVEAYHPDMGVQEVWRRVPENLLERRRLDYAQTNWTKLSDESIRWQSIEIKPVVPINDTVVEVGGCTLVLVEGKRSFEAGSPFAHTLDYQLRRPPRKINMPSFYCGAREITTQQFIDVMEQLPVEWVQAYGDTLVGDQQPITNLTFFDALEFCERIGARLPTFDEYVFAATRGGESQFPWGNDSSLIASWRFEIGELPDYDRIPGATSIDHLYSSVLEWTQEIDMTMDIRVGNSQNFPEAMTNWSDSRFVVGGPPAMIFGDSARFDASEVPGPRAFLDVIPTRTRRGLGFRCYRSIEPRFVESGNSD